MELFERLANTDPFLVIIADIIEYSAVDSFNRRKVFEHYEIVNEFLNVMDRYTPLAVRIWLH